MIEHYSSMTEPYSSIINYHLMQTPTSCNRRHCVAQDKFVNVKVALLIGLWGYTLILLCYIYYVYIYYAMLYYAAIP